ncbi:alpha/beta fold hydrolase [Knoellia sp. 3-2P3]|uniref:alpha/beta hydrolase family protein n=1 Tax=unclassified Knoellia TaxID=2618719 RepID=UPI0023DAD461|nr:alpha/beta fold hydrolase [Knoellia sp. 3-2P3]MDF2091080.1 alpha/beta fold hydrolase [Knoellia sp. 3-2P3]
MSAPELRWTHEAKEPRGVVLLLHGGKSSSHMPTSWWNLPVLRMKPFAWTIAAESRGELSVAVLRYAVRGWNGSAASPVVDAQEALDTIAARHPGVPLGLLGHSMGGRVAFRLAGDRRVAALVALAPWVERSDLARGHPGLRALVMHGTRDRITSPRNAKAMADAMAALGVDVTWRAVEGETHSMLRQAGAWHRESAQFLTESLHAGLQRP